ENRPIVSRDGRVTIVRQIEPQRGQCSFALLDHICAALAALRGISLKFVDVIQKRVHIVARDVRPVISNPEPAAQILTNLSERSGISVGDASTLYLVAVSFPCLP